MAEIGYFAWLGDTTRVGSSYVFGRGVAMFSRWGLVDILDRLYRGVHGKCSGWDWCRSCMQGNCRGVGSTEGEVVTVGIGFRFWFGGRGKVPKIEGPRLPGELGWLGGPGAQDWKGGHL
ncbi:hypothetical protein Salat_1464600 [Sesamum alatum]|uniref:Uncharacterized protein n=1 Tax=Sesamum alatum TaxID=300844 RepID=A0AAE1YCA1_9LAMI|nr:hypothetical protein Salat_1464600 [Sesamum alatum]